MTDITLTLLDSGRPQAIPARLAEGSVRIDPAAAGLGPPGEVELEALAAALDRPLALDVAERAAYLGVSARTRGERLRSLEAPGFALPDLDGRPHALAEHRGRKVFLVAWASW
jgi:hypothetical protein